LITTVTSRGSRKAAAAVVERVGVDAVRGYIDLDVSGGQRHGGRESVARRRLGRISGTASAMALGDTIDTLLDRHHPDLRAPLDVLWAVRADESSQTVDRAESLVPRGC
jgi:hypothetical protein